MSSDYDKFKYNLALNDIDADKATRGVKLEKFGIIDSTTLDQTSLLQTALTTASTDNLLLYGGNLHIKITSALSVTSFPGLVFDAVGYSSSDPGIIVSGSGYTALTITTKVSRLALGMYGSANTANGIKFQNPVLSNVDNVRVYNLNGYGVLINKCYDCSFKRISTELCGNSSNYAFSVNDDGDTSNMSNFDWIQIEQANQKALYVAPESLSLTFGLIHSERLLNPSSSVYAWQFGGGTCRYGSLRFTANTTPANAKVYYTGVSTTCGPLRTEGAIDVTLEGSNGHGITLDTPNIEGTCHELTSQIGKLTILGGEINQWTGNKTNRTTYNTIITTDS